MKIKHLREIIKDYRKLINDIYVITTNNKTNNIIKI
jgi:hypothetical protein